MYKGNTILAVVPARSGSKGISLKNLREINGIPLVGHAGIVAGEVAIIDRSVVSTDHDDIANVAMKYGLDAPFRRPPEISGDLIGDIDVLTHALIATERDDQNHYNIIVMLQPTSPLRRARHVTDTIEKLVNDELDAVWTVSETDSKNHPHKQLVIEDDELDYYDPGGMNIIVRQQLSPVYHRNGVAYALTRKCLLQTKALMGRRTGSLILEGEHVSIDTEWDIKLVEFILANREKNQSASGSHTNSGNSY